MKTKAPKRYTPAWYKFIDKNKDSCNSSCWTCWIACVEKGGCQN